VSVAGTFRVSYGHVWRGAVWPRESVSGGDFSCVLRASLAVVGAWHRKNVTGRGSSYAPRTSLADGRARAKRGGY